MKKYFPGKPIIWIINIMIVAMYCLLLDKINIQNIVFIIVFEAVVLFFSYRMSVRKQVIMSNEGKIGIRGISKNMEINEGDILKLEVRRNMMATVMDWSQVVIETKEKTYKIYTRRMADADIQILAGLMRRIS